MNSATFKCIFVSRNNITQFTIKTSEDKCIDVVYYGKHNPILRGVVYDVHLAKELRILDGERTWNKEVHAMFFPTAEFQPEWNPGYYLRQAGLISKACAAWLQFDLDFRIQSLIPHLPAIKYASYVKEGITGLERLVYSIGGVDPLALRKAGGTPELVRDAANLRHVANITKRLRSSPWLSQKDCASFMVKDPETMASFARLVEKGAIVKRKQDGDNGGQEIALAWAAKQDVKAKSGVGEYVPYLEPTLASSVVMQGDPSMRMDRSIDHRILPCTMWSRATWEKVAPQVAMINVKGRREAMETLKLEIQRCFSEGCRTHIVFSSRGRMGVDRPGMWTCCDKKGTIKQIKICVHNAGMLLVGGVETPKLEVYEEWTNCDRKKWTDLAYMNISSGVDVIVGIFTTNADMEWVSRLHCNNSARKILIRLTNKN